MIRLFYVGERKWLEYPEDIETMQNYLKHRGIISTPTDLGLAWQSYSNSLSAGWMALPFEDDASENKHDDILLNILLSFMNACK